MTGPAEVAAFLGGPGSFSEEARERFVPDATPLPCHNFAEVRQAVIDGRAAVGLLPVRNSAIGTIAENADLADDPRVAIERQEALPIELHLWTREGIGRKELKAVSSHPAALAQCSTYLGLLRLPTIWAESTGEAAAEVARSADPIAAIAGERAGRATGLTMLDSSVQDGIGNETIFAIFRRA